jgi:hypothetical protein
MLLGRRHRGVGAACVATPIENMLHGAYSIARTLEPRQFAEFILLFPKAEAHQTELGVGVASDRFPSEGSNKRFP